MIPKEILKQIRHIEIRTGKLVNELFAGEYESVFKGRGMEFSEVREYQPGDDIRTIDWNVTARFGKPFIKKFIEERELTIMLLVDLSSSKNFGTQEKTKSQIAAEIASILAFSAIKNNDKVGTILFTDRPEAFIPPKKGRRHILRIIREILYFKPTHYQTDISSALEYLNEIAKRKMIVFLISDFIDQGYEKTLHITNKRHDVIAITITDPREKELPSLGFIELEDSETKKRILIDTRDKSLRNSFSEINKQKETDRKAFFQSIGLDNIDISCGRSYIEPLISFFRMRARRFR